MQPDLLDGIKRILAIAAHPDDLDFMAGGSVAWWTAAGIEVTYGVVTSGEAGAPDPIVDQAELARTRQREQRASADLLGVRDVVFLGYPDGRVEPTLALRRDLARLIRKVRPQRVVCQSPERNYTRIYASHPDHLATGEATLRAVYPDSRNHFAHPELAAEGLEPWTVPEVWLAPVPAADHYVDITGTFATKLAALRCHASQIADPTGIEAVIRNWAGGVAAGAGLAEGRLAEGFLRVPTV
ncbi:MAG: PIG-L deacetylase family protein [Acidimicrobiales bacterium]